MSNKIKSVCIKAINAKPNFTAMLLSAVLLAIIIFVFGDVTAYQDAVEQRNEFANSVALAIRQGTGVDSELIDDKEAEIDENIQALAMSTDLGKLLAKNDLTSDGRIYNQFITRGVALTGLLMVAMIFLNIYRMFHYIGSRLFRRTA